MYSQPNQQELTFWQWDLPSRSHKIHYIERGRGPHHVLLLHGFAAHSFTWRGVIDELVQAGYHVWSIDLIGFGYSDKPVKCSYGLDLFTDQLEAFMRAKQIDHASVIGNSMGGGLALSLAMTVPERVQSLVLIDAFVFPIKLPFYFAMTKMLGKGVKPFMGKTMVKKILNQIIYDRKKISEDQILAYDFPLHTPGGKDAFIQTLQNFNDHELEVFVSHLEKIEVPVLIIWGEKDRWMPLDYFQRLSQRFPKAKKLIIPNCGHAPQEERPLEVSRAILQFLEPI